MKNPQYQVFIRLNPSLKLNQKLYWYDSIHFSSSKKEREVFYYFTVLYFKIWWVKMMLNFYHSFFPILNFCCASVLLFQCKFYKRKEAVACLRVSHNKQGETISYQEIESLLADINFLTSDQDKKILLCLEMLVKRRVFTQVCIL